MREPNILLDALIDEAGMSHDGLASRVNQAGSQHGVVLLYDHASVRRWIRDATVPRGRVPELICEVLSMRLGRTVTLPDAGLDRGAAEGDGAPLAKTVDAATALWRSDFKQAAAHSHARGRVHRLATLATILAGQGDAEEAAGTAAVMLDQAAGMESRRIQDRIVRVRDAVTGVSDGRAAAELAERVADMTGVSLRRR